MADDRSKYEEPAEWFYLREIRNLCSESFAPQELALLALGTEKDPLRTLYTIKADMRFHGCGDIRAFWNHFCGDGVPDHKYAHCWIGDWCKKMEHVRDAMKAGVLNHRNEIILEADGYAWLANHFRGKSLSIPPEWGTGQGDAGSKSSPSRQTPAWVKRLNKPNLRWEQVRINVTKMGVLVTVTGHEPILENWASLGLSVGTKPVTLLQNWQDLGWHEMRNTEKNTVRRLVDALRKCSGIEILPITRKKDGTATRLFKMSKDVSGNAIPAPEGGASALPRNTFSTGRAGGRKNR